jgi:VacB/RNase II family 3'-5' exoribonuclease
MWYIRAGSDRDMKFTFPIELEFSRLRADLGVPSEFPEIVLDAAQARARRVPLKDDERAKRANYTFIPFVTVDPEGARDLDQAFFAQRRGDGFIVLYAIADVGYFVDRGGAIETEAWRRGLTFYSPDTKTPLYPQILSEGAASLLPHEERPCIVFSFLLEADGEARLVGVERSIIVSRMQLSYEEVAQHLTAEREKRGSGQFAGEEWAESLELLEVIGRLRQKIERERGAVSLPIAAQHVSQWAGAVHGYRLTLESQDDVEEWNAQISLMTGIAAADVMIGRSIGILRTLDPPRGERIDALRITAAALGIAWPRGRSYADFIHSLDPTHPREAAVIFHAAGALGGARYLAFEGSVPPGARHSAVAAYYAHVTAPLRRLADRYALDLLVELAAGREPEGDVKLALAEVAPVMGEAERLARRLENAIVDVAEAFFLAHRVGETFDGLILRLYEDRVTVQITDPPVRATVPLSRFPEDFFHDPVSSDDGAPPSSGSFRLALGLPLRLRLDEADVSRGAVTFTPL